MAELEIAPLKQRLEEDEIARLLVQLREKGVSRLPRVDGSSTTLGNRIDEEALEEFLDLLETHEAACDIYLPVDFSGQLDVGDLRVGTTKVLMEALEELRGDLDIEEEEEEEEASDDGDEMDTKLRNLWRLFQQGAEASAERRLPLHVHP